MKYKKKPIIIEAFQYFVNMGEHTNSIPHWFIKATMDGIVHEKNTRDYIKTLEGDLLISDGDYVIKGIKGELYPCKPDIFEMTYERVTE